MHRPGRDLDPRGPGRGPPGRGPPGGPGPARRRGPATRSAVVAGYPVPRGRRSGRGLHRHRRAAAVVRTGQPGRVPDGAGRADQRAQARTRPARRAQPRLRGRPDHGHRRQPAAAGRYGRPAHHRRGRGRPDRPARARSAGLRHARGGAGRRDLAGMPEDADMTQHPESVTVVVADDQSAVREGLVLLLGTVPGIAVTGEAEDGEVAVEIVAAKNPQVVLMDLNMPRCDGVEATRRIRASHPQTQVVVLTTYSDDESIIGALQAGALGYLTKDATRAEIGRAVLAAAAGQAVLDPEVQQRLLSAAARAPAARTAAGPAGGAGDPADTDLTPRESEVLRLIAAGKSNREIARALFVSEATVKTHVNRIFAKTGSRDRTQAMRYAYTHGYADPRLPFTAGLRGAPRPAPCRSAARASSAGAGSRRWSTRRTRPHRPAGAPPTGPREPAGPEFLCRTGSFHAPATPAAPSGR